MTDGELLRERIETIRMIGRMTDYLAIINEEQISRRADDREARIIPFQRGEL